MPEFEVRTFYKKSILPCIIIFSISLFLIYGTLQFIETNGIIHLIQTIVIEFTFISIIIFILGINRQQRHIVKEFIKKKYQK